MDSFINFLNEYKSVLVGGLTLILTIVLLFIKRRPKTLDDFSLYLAEVINVLPKLIIGVEIPSNGLMKKKEVISSSLNLLSKKLGRELSKSELDIAYHDISSSIEDILTAPQKKGV